MEKEFAGLEIHEEEDDAVVGETQTLIEKEADLTLIGRFLTGKPINFQVMQNRMATLWRPGRGLAVTEVESNLFGFEFFHEVDKERVLSGGPWSFDNYMLVLNDWKPEVSAEHVDLDWIPIWVQVHDLPPGTMSEFIGKQIGNYIGVFQEYDLNNNTGVRRQFMRIRVLIDVCLPLKQCKKVKRTATEFSYIQFKYERLCNYCFICGLMGHTDRFCEMLFEVPKSEVKRNWGESLKAPARRPVAQFRSRWLREPGSGGSSSAIGGSSSSRGIPKLTMAMKVNLVNKAKQASVVTPNAIPMQVVADAKISNDQDVDMGPNEDENLILSDDRKRRRAEVVANLKQPLGVDGSSNIDTNGANSFSQQDSASIGTNFTARSDDQTRRMK